MKYVRDSTIRISVFYAVTALLWIFLSDRVLLLYIDDPQTLTTLQNYKGTFFVLITTLLLYWVVRREFARKERAEYQLHLLEAGVEQTLDAVVIIAASPPAQLQIVYVNPAFTTMTGFTKEEALGKSILFLLGAHPPQTLLEPLCQNLAQGQPFYGEILATRNEGGDFWMEWSIVPIHRPADEITHFVCVLRDITERKHNHEHIKYQADLLENVSDAIISTDTQGTIKSWNKGAEIIYGWCASEVVGQSVNELLDTAFLDTALEPAFQQVQAIGSWRGEVTQKRKDGSRVHIRASTSLIKDTANLAMGMVSINQDITTAKIAEEAMTKTQQLRLQLQKEKELIDLKENFTSIVSHEFRTPLTVIMTSAEMIQHYFERMTSEKVLSHVQKIYNQTDYMRKLLDDVLIFSKGRAGKLEFCPQPVDLAAFCATLVDALKITDQNAHPVELTCDLPPGQVTADEKLLQHILVNLLSNAAKYSPAGSPVELSVSAENSHVTFRVRDHGIGISAADQKRLFEPFYRSAQVRHINGTGLGLAIVKNNVDRYGGTITCDSTEGVGTTFTVHLPVDFPH